MKEEVGLPQRYVQASVAWQRRLGLMRIPLSGIPEEMRDADVPQENDWVGWKLIPSTVTDQELDELEATIGLSFPPLYRQFLRSYHFYDLVGLRFCRHPIQTWRKELTELYQAYSAKPLSDGLIPFGEEPMMDAGPACFDTRARMADGDCPVVFWDHEWKGTEKEVRPLFSSSAAMFRCLCLWAEAEVDFVYHDEDDPPEELPSKRALMARFLALDPEGAGGAARGYWTGWGVVPEAT